MTAEEYPALDVISSKFSTYCRDCYKARSFPASSSTNNIFMVKQNTSRMIMVLPTNFLYHFLVATGQQSQSYVYVVNIALAPLCFCIPENLHIAEKKLDNHKPMQ